MPPDGRVQDRRAWRARKARRRRLPRHGADFAQALLLTTEPVLEESDFTALLLSCRATKNGQGRRTVTERAEGHRLLASVEASKADAFTTEMLAFLCNYLRGDPLRGQGAPRKRASLVSGSAGTDTVAAYINEDIYFCRPKRRGLLRSCTSFWSFRGPQRTIRWMRWCTCWLGRVKGGTSEQPMQDLKLSVKAEITEGHRATTLKIRGRPKDSRADRDPLLGTKPGYALLSHESGLRTFAQVAELRPVGFQRRDHFEAS